jgi:hypothetical protein
MKCNTGFCIAHGGGRRCQEEDCSKSALGDTGYCVSHGGGRRFQEAGCFKGSSNRHGVLRGARRWQTLPAHGLRQGSCYRRHAAVQGTWRGQALPARGLFQVRSRRHGTLVMNLQFSILMAQTTDPSSWR